MSKAKEILSMFESNTNYFLIAGNSDIPLKEKHITLTFMGELSSDSLNKVKSIVDKYFNDNTTKSTNIEFDKPDMFGPNKDVRVLKPSKDVSELLFPKLREQLMDFNASQFKDKFSPHLTTDEEKVDFNINIVAISESGYKVNKEYKL